MAIRATMSPLNFYSPVGIGDCDLETNLCLPVLDSSDIKTQFLVNADNITEDTQIREGQITFYVHVSATCLDGEPSASMPTIHLNVGVEPLGAPGDLKFVVFTKEWALDFIDDITPGACFYLNLIMKDATGEESTYTQIACSHCLQKITDPCFTSVIKYRSNDDQNYFYYDSGSFNAADEGYYNIVRLPFYLHGLQLPTEEKSYTKSNGSKIKLFARIEREYDLIVDMMRKEHHTMLQAALNHDTVIITNTNEAGIDDTEFVSSDKYNIEWPEMPRYAMASARTKVRQADAVSLTNNNCR